jgi:DUF4097 and DUF4098 domain-containing protein YvlB
MTSSVRNILVVSLTALVLSLLSDAALAQEMRRSGDRYVRSTTKTFDVGSGGALDIETVGAVTVVGSDRASVEVEETVRIYTNNRERAERLAAELEAEYTVDGTTLRIRTNDEVQSSRLSWSFEIRVPRRFDVDVETASGPVSISDIQGRVDGETSGGPVSISNIDGTVYGETRGGPVSLEQISEDATAETYGGPISARDIGGALEAETYGGPISVVGVGNDARLETAGGGISVRDVSGSLRAETAGGGISIRSVSGDVFAETAGGGIDCTEIGGSLDAETAGGDIEGSVIGGPVTVQTRAGDIELSGVAASIMAETSVGDIEVQMDAAGSDNSSFEASHGDIRLTLPGDIAARLDIEVRSSWGGGIDRDDIESDFPITLDSDRDDRSVRATGDLNGGGPTIQIRTRGGSVEIRKR